MADRTRALHRIAKTGFYVSLVSYLLFWGADLLRPGFVSRQLSVHVFLLATLIFGGWWSLQIRAYKERPWIRWIVTVIVALGASVIAWFVGAPLGSVHILLVVLAFFIPILVSLFLAEHHD